jgi:phage gpG-like protein
MATTRTTININLAMAEGLSAQAVERGVRAATSEAKARLIGDVLSTPGKGRIYTHYFFTYNGRLIRGKKRDKPHRASAPGDAPAVDDGGLRQSVQSEVSNTSNGSVGVVSVNKEYAEHLQFGTEKMAPRPFMNILIRDYGKRIQEAFTRYARLPR